MNAPAELTTIGMKELLVHKLYRGVVDAQDGSVMILMTLDVKKPWARRDKSMVRLFD